MPALISRLIQSLRRNAARLRGARIPANCLLGPATEFIPGFRSGAKGGLRLGERCRLEHGAVLHAWGGSIRLGNDVFIGPYSVIYGHGGVEIGDDALVSMHCRILSSEHTVPSLDRHIRWEPDILKPTRIGRDVWLGAGVTVLGGVTIGDGCVVGAGAVVTNDLPPGSIAVGVPARVVRQRSPAPRG